MRQSSILILIGLIGLVASTAFVLAFSPLTKTLFDFSRGGDTMDDVLGLLIGILMLFGSGAIAITWIIACCKLGKRLGYDLYAVCYWSFLGSICLCFFTGHSKNRRTNAGSGNYAPKKTNHE